MRSLAFFTFLPGCSRYTIRLHRSFVRRPLVLKAHRACRSNHSVLPSCTTSDSPSRDLLVRCSSSPPSRTNKYYTPRYLSSTTTDNDSFVAENDTIYALATGYASAAGVAIMRISGPRAGNALLSLTRKKELPKPRLATLRTLYDPTTEQILDKALVLYFPKPHSYTSEDVIELHIHGSRAVILSISKCLSALSLRVANRGEFTRRAYENGTVDLVNVESLSDLIDAETDSQRIQALQGLLGESSKVIQRWRETLIKSLARIEAVLDFVDDVGDTPLQGMDDVIAQLVHEMTHHLSLSFRTQVIRTGANIVLIGPPNAGKSSLLNALTQHDAAIVSPIAGTTRDVVQVRVDFNGIAASVSDTAGLRYDPSDIIEIEGINRTHLAASSAHVIVCVYDASTSHDELEDSIRLTKESIANQNHKEENFEPHVLYVFNKTDLCESSTTSSSSLSDSISNDDLFHTCLIQEQKKGLSQLISRIEVVLKKQLEVRDEQNQDMAPVITRERHRRHVQNAINSLTAFIDGQSAENVALRMPMDLAAEDLRTACKEIGAITGEIDAEEVLDVLFNEFCIGK